MEASINGGYPNSWLVFVRENPIEMDDLGVPLSPETSKKNYPKNPWNNRRNPASQKIQRTNHTYCGRIYAANHHYDV